MQQLPRFVGEPPEGGLATHPFPVELVKELKGCPAEIDYFQLFSWAGCHLLRAALGPAAERNQKPRLVKRPRPLCNVKARG